MTARLARPPFRADHVGSLLRPGELRAAFKARREGSIGALDFADVQDAAIRDAVEMQEEIGLQVVTDGEFRRGSYWGRFVERVDGFEIRKADFRFRDDHGHETEFTAPYAAARLKRSRPLAVDEFAFLEKVTKVTAKITLPSPSTMHFYRCTDFADRAVYADEDAFFADLAEVYRGEVADLAAAGCRYVQLDEVAIALLCDPSIRAQVESHGLDPDALVDRYILAINDALDGAPADLVVGVHMCRGNLKGQYLAAGGYESVAERFFQQTAVNHFLLEFDTPRAGDFSPLRFVPKDKGVVLGLVSTKTGELEPLDLLRRRVEEAGGFIDVGQLGIGPQCGFASTVAGNPVDESVERAKLARVVEAADSIWRREDGLS